MGMKEGKGDLWAGKNRFAHPTSCREISICQSTADILGSENSVSSTRNSVVGIYGDLATFLLWDSPLLRIVLSSSENACTMGPHHIPSLPTLSKVPRRVGQEEGVYLQHLEPSFGAL